jgi:XPG I-region
MVSNTPLYLFLLCLTITVSNWHLILQAHGEAEAELARMSQAGVIDMVLTEDSDSMIFGTTRVARS